MRYIVWTGVVICLVGGLSADVLQSQADVILNGPVVPHSRQAPAPFTEPRAISTTGYPFENPKEEVSTIGTLPRCFKPELRVVDANILEDYWDWTGYKISGAARPFVSLFQKPNGYIEAGSGNYVEVRHTNRHVKPGRGALVTVDFIPDGSCADNYTDFTKLVCMPQNSPDGGFMIETPLYPNATHKGMVCRHIEEIRSRLTSHNVYVDYKLNAGETLHIDFGHWYRIRVTGPKNETLMAPGSYPYLVAFKANDTNPGYWNMRAEPVDVDEPCNTVTNVDGNVTIEFPPKYRPLPGCLYPKGILCNMMFKTVNDKYLQFNIVSASLAYHERLIVYSNPGDRYAPHNNVRSPEVVKVQRNMTMMSYYNELNSVFSSWKVTVSEIDKY